MYGFLLFLHLLICLCLIGVVLIQSGKGGGLAGGAFGGSAQTVFGGRGATDFFTKATMVLGAAFFITSLTLALMSSGGGPSRSLIQGEARRATQGAPPPGSTPPAGTSTPAAPATGAPATGPTTPAPATPQAPAPAAPQAPAPAPAGGGGR